MSRRTIFAALLFLLGITGLATWSVLRKGGAETAPEPPAPEALSGKSTVFSPGPPLLPLPPEALAAAATPAEGPGAPAEKAGWQALAAEAFARVLAALRRHGDVVAYVLEDEAPKWTLVPVPDEVRAKLFALLEGEDRGAALTAALALAAVELTAGELATLRDRFDFELAGLEDEAGKNAVLGISFALATHGEEHGLAALTDALRSGRGAEVKDFRSGAALVLGMVRHEPAAAVLRDLLAADPDRVVRKTAAQGLGTIGGEESRRALADALAREQDVAVRAWSALAESRAAGKGRGDPVLLRVLREDGSGEVRAAAAFGLSRSGGKGTVAALTDAYYRDGHAFARVGAVAGVVRRGKGERAREFIESEASPWLERAVREEPDDGARFYGTITLGRLPRSESRAAALRDVAAKDPSGWVRVVAVDAVAKTDGEAALPFLRSRLAEEKNPIVKSAIERALKRLD